MPLLWKPRINNNWLSRFSWRLVMQKAASWS